MRFVGIITARGGSKGIPGKNIADLGGKPLIAWTIEAALQSKCLQKIIVSTDDDQIAEISRKFGAEVPFKRPEELSGDKSAHIPVVQHAVKWLEDNGNAVYDYIVLLQPTSPFRIGEDIDAAAKLAIEKNAVAITSVSSTGCHPCYAQKINKEGIVEHYIERANDEYVRRQDLEPAYIENGAIFIVRRDALMNDNVLDPAGQTYACIMPEERALDIDTPLDLRIANLLMNDRLNA